MPRYDILGQEFHGGSEGDGAGGCDLLQILRFGQQAAWAALWDSSRG